MLIRKRLEISVFINRLDGLKTEIEKIQEDILICNVSMRILKISLNRKRKFVKAIENAGNPAEIERIRAKTVEIEKSMEYSST